MPRPAKERYDLRILPAGRNDRVAQISDRAGRIVKLIYCHHSLAEEPSNELDAVIRRDWETLDEVEFGRKYLAGA